MIIGPNNGEGVHCLGPCTLNNVWWTDVCEDALTIKQSSGTSYVNGGGAFNAEDKIIQHNGGGTVAVKNFYVREPLSSRFSFTLIDFDSCSLAILSANLII